VAKYMIESPHTKEDCLRALDEIVAQDPRFLQKFDFGCMAGVHTGWAIVDAGSESAARNMLPSFLRAKARVTGLNKFTPEQIKSFHEKK
jgi:hypothetical protein